MEKMEIHHKSFSAKIFFCSIIILICSSCGIKRSYLKDDKKSPPGKKALIESDFTPSRKLPDQKTSSPDKMEVKGDPPLTKSAENKTISQATENQKKKNISDKIEEKEAPFLTETANNKTSPQATEDQGNIKIAAPNRTEGKELIPFPEIENKTISQATEDQKKEKIRYPDKIAKKEAPPLTEAADNKTSPQASKKQEKSDQQKLDLALEFCQASNDFWDQGDLDNSLDALDHAYSLILKVNPDHNPKILQQKEDLRFTISIRIIEVYSSRF
ncbi:MAG: hypothetical protein JSV50_00185 [Desulfobacteraceae bacterium]|nr:MAG: hypothetical protein JSV50_00185 [Desulfobacteraceae bacterium]